MVHVVARRRPSSSPCCTYCRAEDAPDRCECGARYHADCRVTLGRGRCSTLGCRSREERQTRPLRCGYCDGAEDLVRTCACGTVYHPACREALALGRCWSASCSGRRPTLTRPPDARPDLLAMCVVGAMVGTVPGFILGLAFGVMKHIVLTGAPRLVLTQGIVESIIQEAFIGMAVGSVLLAVLVRVTGKLPGHEPQRLVTGRG